MTQDTRHKARIGRTAQESTPWWPELAKPRDGAPNVVVILFAPAGLPGDVLARLNTVLNQWIRLPETAAFFEQKQNSPAPIPLTPDQFVQLLQRDVAAWKRLIADSKVVL